jgi:geranylgeranylglycerol-phosphate geranylgeranyltransferase
MNIAARIIPLIKLSRLLNVLITFFSVIVAVIICSDVFSVTKNIILAAISASLTTAAGNIINDIFDFKSDSVNKPERPLPSGKVSRTAALNFYFIILLLSLLSSFIINSSIFTIVLLTNLLLVLYSSALKKILIVGNIVVSFLTGFVFIFGGIIAGNIDAAFIPAVFAFMINFAREGIKTIEDIPGDRRSGVITFPQVFGLDFSRKMISMFLSLLILLTFIPFLKGIYGFTYFVIILVVVNPLLGYVIKSLLENKNAINMKKLSLILKLNMIFGLTAIYFGR